MTNPIGGYPTTTAELKMGPEQRRNEFLHLRDTSARVVAICLGLKAEDALTVCHLREERKDGDQAVGKKIADPLVVAKRATRIRIVINFR